MYGRLNPLVIKGLVTAFPLIFLNFCTRHCGQVCVSLVLLMLLIDRSFLF